MYAILIMFFPYLLVNQHIQLITLLIDDVASWWFAISLCLMQELQDCVSLINNPISTHHTQYLVYLRKRDETELNISKPPRYQAQYILAEDIWYWLWIESDRIHSVGKNSPGAPGKVGEEQHTGVAGVRTHRVYRPRSWRSLQQPRPS